MSKEERKVPELRFKGFHDDWEQRKFFENIKSVIDYRGRTPKKLNMEWSDTGYLALSALNVKNGFIDKTIDAKYGSEELYKKWMGGNTLSKGFVLFTTEAPMGNVALVPDDDGYILSQRTVAFDTHKDKMTNLFLATTLCTPRVINNLRSLSSGATAKGVSQKSLRALEIIVPEKLEEQRRIGYFLDAIDKIIILHQRKINILNVFRKDIINALFIKKDDVLPSIYFSHFDNTWEKHLLQRGMTKYTDRIFIQDDIDYHQISIKNSGEIIPRGIKKGVNIGRKRQSKINLSKYPSTLLFTRQTVEQGGIGFAPTEVDESIVTENMPTISVNTEIYNKLFLSALFQTIYFRKQVILPNITGGTAQVAIHEDNILLSYIKSPHINEQEKIGYFYKEVKKAVDLYMKKVSTLSKIKQEYLNKMFI